MWGTLDNKLLFNNGCGKNAKTWRVKGVLLDKAQGLFKLIGVE